MNDIVTNFGVWSLVPPILAIVLAFKTKQVIPSLFAAIFAGATIIAGGNIIIGFRDTMITYIAGSVASPWNAGIIVFDIGLGGMIGLVAKSGGAKAIAEWLGKKARSAKSAMVATWAMGLVIFFDDYSNTLLVGSTMRPLTDKKKISREKLAFLTDSTAAPVASMALISTWIAYEMGLLKDVFATINVDINIYSAFIQSIPFRFYSLIMLGFVLIIALTGRDYGPMLKAERRARYENKLVGDNSKPLASKELTEMKIKDDMPLRIRNAVLPVLTVVVVVILGLYFTGRNAILAGENVALINMVNQSPLAAATLREILGKANTVHAMIIAAYSGSLVAFVLALSQKILTFEEAMQGWIDGAKSLVIAIMVLVLAWGIGSVCKQLGTATFLVSFFQGRIPASIVPFAVFVIGAVIAFATGTSWGTTAIMMPLAVPLVYELSGGSTGTILFATIGAVFTGAVFGDHCSPISDTTIMSSMSAASDHLDHVKTQIPYALTVAFIAGIIGYIPAGFLNMNPLFSIVAGLAVSYGIIRFKGQLVEDPDYKHILESDENPISDSEVENI